ncbi:hypothetical protein PR202_ga15457 [Eleusine coracana subsp. coracana]|uniref:DNA primase large subunit C-terminal domain-containing protein n=1 Tax=Eleusine coracana subsp. coracana TaxID=191504 RepID=A0AAV5CK82_ELECO|nr:hypothetical protein PR202_ga15457 [Eleusine coracana subsp. coracana]
MLMTEFQLPYKALPHSEFEAVKDKLSQVARSIGQSANVESLFFKVPFEEVPDLVARLCLLKGYAYVAMSQLRENHHLKHGGRVQFGLFLKGAGLKFEEALAFWRAEFSQKVGSERFDKEYAYSIRHNYGKEGKRTDYTLYSCQKIISATPGVGNHHGCPYRHFGYDHILKMNFLEENLRAAINKMGVRGHALEDIMDKVKNRHYQVLYVMINSLIKQYGITELN